MPEDMLSCVRARSSIGT